MTSCRNPLNFEPKSLTHAYGKGENEKYLMQKVSN